MITVKNMKTIKNTLIAVAATAVLTAAITTYTVLKFSKKSV